MTIPKPTLPSALRDRLDPLIPDYRRCLEQQGITSSWINTLVGSATHLVIWLTARRVDIRALDIRMIDDFMAHDCSCPGRFVSHPPHGYARSRAQRFLTYLMDITLVEMPAFILQSNEHIDAFLHHLSGQGYCDSTVQEFRWTCRHFIVWLYRSNRTLEQIDEDMIRRFSEHECTCSCPRFYRKFRFNGTPRYRARVIRFVDWLAGKGVIGNWREADPPGERSELVDRFIEWMRHHRGLRETTLRNYGWLLHRKILPELGSDPASYDAGSIRTAFTNLAPFRSSSHASGIASALRGYLRYLGVHGLCRPGLVAAVPAVKHQPACDLPRYVSRSEIEALIGSCDPTTPVGLRDHAILLLLARLALRAGDIVALRLDDIDWEQARIRVTGKTRRTLALPLPQDAGDALKTYLLEGRPRVHNEMVFLCACAPYRALSNQGTVSCIVRRAKKRIGMEGRSLPASHLFRHSQATHLLRGGESLETVATLLRHQSVRTTTLYARVDRPMLLEVAQPWPGGAS